MKDFNVFPREIEEQLMSQSNISSVCVVGKQDDRSGEIPVAFITLETNVDISIIKKYCKDTMLAYKVSSEFIVLENLPLTPAKKVDRVASKAKLTSRALLRLWIKTLQISKRNVFPCLYFFHTLELRKVR